MSWLIFALLTPFFYSLTNYIEKFIIDKRIKDPYVMTLFGGIFYFLIGFFVSAIHGFHSLPFFQIIFIFISGIFLVIYLIPYYKALAIDEASRVVPLFQFIPVFTLILSYLFLGEHLNSMQFLGFLFIVFGGFIIGTEKFEKGIFIPRKSFWYMMLSSFLYSLVEVIFKFVVKDHDFYTTFLYQSLGIGLATLILLSNKNLRKSFVLALKKSSAPVYTGLFLSQCFGFLGEFSGAFAISLASVSLVSAIGGLQPLFVFLFGIILSVWFPKIIKEDISKINLAIKSVSIILICIGIYFIYI